jgi:hypothetical protein
MGRTPWQRLGGAERLGILRLHESSASRTTHSAQDDISLGTRLNLCLLAFRAKLLHNNSLS